VVVEVVVLVVDDVVVSAGASEKVEGRTKYMTARLDAAIRLR
jgi:hypothetical protein